MREIKFRAWDKKNKKMFMPLELDQSSKDNKIYMIRDNFLSLRLIKKEKIVLMQYTGLKDKNEKEIYEGDLIYYTCNGFNGKVTRDYKVGFDEEKGRFVLYDLNAKFGYYDDFYPTIYDSLEIIGNIYENPELLKIK